MNRAIKICFVDPAGYGAFVDRINLTGGGISAQLSRIASELIKRKYSISLISHSPVPQDQVTDGIQIFALKKFPDVFIIGRFIQTIFLWMSLVRSKSDVYIYRGMGWAVGIIAIFCKLYKKRFFYSIANDPNIDGTKYHKMYWFDRLAWKWACSNATCIIVQSQQQSDTLRKTFGFSSKIIPNGIEIDFWKPDWKDRVEYVIWIAVIRPIKRFDRLVSIAKKCSSIKFLAVGPVQKGSEHELAALPQNLVYFGPATENQVKELFQKSYCLLNTSDYEGFPNTFLEAWALGKPVISLGVNIDNLLKKPLGKVCKNEDDAIVSIKSLVSLNKEKRNKIQSNIIEFVKKKYDIQSVADEWERIIKLNN